MTWSDGSVRQPVSVAVVLALLLSALGLGLAGLDPTGALLLVAALVAGASRGASLMFGFVLLLGTAVLGTALSLSLGQQLANVRWADLLPDGTFGVVLELALAAALVAWGVRRLRGRSGARRGRNPNAGKNPVRLIAIGVVFTVSALLDPSYLAMIVVAGREDHIVVTALAQIVWAIVSQLPLAIVLGAVVAGRHDRAVVAFQRSWARLRAPVAHLVTGALLVASAFLMLDAGWYVSTGHFLVD